jgi:hypothetical protein
VGKSSIVAQTARKHGIGFIDLRLSQLAPTDLRGLPVPVDGVSRWYPPEFLPSEGEGILFLDELNMDAGDGPAAHSGPQGGLLEGWFVWAAGNRKEERAAAPISALF